MTIHPPAELRPYSVALLGLSALAVGGAALASGWALVFGDPDVGGFGLAALGCGFVGASVLAAGLAVLTRVIHLGPNDSRTRRGPSAETLRAGSLLLVASFLLGFASLAVEEQLAGEALVSPLVVWGLAGTLGLLGGVAAFGFCLVVGNRLLRGPTRFEPDATPVRAGKTLRGRLEVPFAAERRMELCIHLELGRSVPGPNPDDPPERCVVYRATTTAVASSPAGPRRAAARIELPLDLEPPSDEHEPSVSYFWHMEVKALREGVWWNALLDPEIEIKG